MVVPRFVDVIARRVLEIVVLRVRAKSYKELEIEREEDTLRVQVQACAQTQSNLAEPDYTGHDPIASEPPAHFDAPETLNGNQNASADPAPVDNQVTLLLDGLENQDAGAQHQETRPVPPAPSETEKPPIPAKPRHHDRYVYVPEYRMWKKQRDDT